MQTNFLLGVVVSGALALAAGLVGCGGDEIIGDDDVGSSSSSSGGSGTDAGSAVVLPDGLEECSITKESTPRRNGYLSQHFGIASPYGKIIRAGKLLLEPRVTFADRRYETTNLYAFSAEDASPYDVAFPPDWAQSPAIDLAGQRKDIAEYLESVRSLPDEELHFAVEYDQSAFLVSGAEPTPPAAGNEPDDEYVFAVGGHSLYRLDVILGFNHDGACHVRNLRKILGAPYASPRQLELVELASDAGQAAAIQTYFDRAQLGRVGSSTFVVEHEFTLGSSSDSGLFSVTSDCGPESFAKCAGILPLAKARRDAFLAARQEPTEAMLAGEEDMPLGWTPLSVQTDLLPQP